MPTSPLKGLSPRVRGNLAGLKNLYDKYGSIPACAGEPSSIVVIYWSNRVYPRVCGGTTEHDQPHHKKKGLSPRVRGNRVSDVFSVS